MTDLDLIKEHDRGYPKKARKRNAWAWCEGYELRKHSRNLMKWRKQPRVPVRVSVSICSCCGQPVNTRNYAEEVWNGSKEL
jgi:hypothetical protein